jgi:hypothetical protein
VITTDNTEGTDKLHIASPWLKFLRSIGEHSRTMTAIGSSHQTTFYPFVLSARSELIRHNVSHETNNILGTKSEYFKK